MIRVVVAILTLASAPLAASADSVATAAERAPSPLSFGVFATGGYQRSWVGTLGVDVSLRLASSPLSAHVQIDKGMSGDAGSMARFRGGIEARTCTQGPWPGGCGFVGVDVGYQHDRVIDHGFALFGPAPVTSTDARDGIAIARLGSEVGRTVRMRGAFEASFYKRIGTDDIGCGLALTLGLVVAL